MGRGCVSNQKPVVAVRMREGRPSTETTRKRGQNPPRDSKYEGRDVARARACELPTKESGLGTGKSARE